MHLHCVLIRCKFECFKVQIFVKRYHFYLMKHDVNWQEIFFQTGWFFVPSFNDFLCYIDQRSLKVITYPGQIVLLSLSIFQRGVIIRQKPFKKREEVSKWDTRKLNESRTDAKRLRFFLVNMMNLTPEWQKKVQKSF